MDQKGATHALRAVQRRRTAVTAANDLSSDKPPRLAKAISLDEMWSYVGARKPPNRNSVWIWTAVVEEADGSRRVFFEVGKRDAATFQKLADHLPLATSYHTDGYEAYRWLPRDQHHVGKYGKTNRNEGIHSILRDRLCRLRRRTKGYSKRLWWLEASIAMICLHMGWI